MQSRPARIALLGLKVAIFAELVLHSGDSVDDLHGERARLDRMIEGIDYHSSTFHSCGKSVSGRKPPKVFCSPLSVELIKVCREPSKSLANGYAAEGQFSHVPGVQRSSLTEVPKQLTHSVGLGGASQTNAGGSPKLGNRLVMPAAHLGPHVVETELETLKVIGKSR
jgi:hypothetical protein